MNPLQSHVNAFSPAEWQPIARLFAPRADLKIWEYAALNVDFSKASNYDTPIHGQYDPEWMPFWKMPVEWLTDYAVREVVCLKCTRAGGSENVFLNTIRYLIAMHPQPTLYLTGDQLTAERFMEKRVKRGMKCSVDTAKAYRQATATQHDITFQSMDFRVSWPKSKQAFKQDGWAVVLFDELSMAPEGSQEQARRRVTSYPFPHIVWLSSPDPTNNRPSDEDPIFVEYEDSDRCVWMMPDPVTGKPFQFEHSGIKWGPESKQAGEWDLKLVEATAYYETPDGTRIEEADRLKVMKSGTWVATNSKGTPGKRGVKVVAPMVPFSDCSFGSLAKEFLLANNQGARALKSYFYERWAAKWYESKQAVNITELDERMGPYVKGESFTLCPQFKAVYVGKRVRRLMTIDVQKLSLYYVIRDWVDNGDSGLVQWDEVSRWDTIETTAIDKKVNEIFIDNSYADRQIEVYQAAKQIKMIPIFGRVLGNLPFMQSIKSPESGVTGAGHSEVETMLTYTFNPDVFKAVYLNYVIGNSASKWYVHADIDRKYASQATAEECIDGVWQAKKGQPKNHLFDCEVYQVLGAAVLGFVKVT